MIHKRTTLETIESYIEFYAQYNTKDLQLKKLINLNLKLIKKKLLEEMNIKEESNEK